VNIVRSVVAVLIGYVVFAGSAVLLFNITKRDPHSPQNLGFIVFAAVYGMFFAGLGGLLADRIAPKKGTVHAAFVSLLIALGAAVSLLAAPGAGSTWSQWAALVLMAPSAWAAAKARSVFGVTR
jgi:RsiW-degrading membrane proteinase PrsW (M82 family)